MNSKFYKELRRKAAENTLAKLISFFLITSGTIMSFFIPWFAKLLVDGKDFKKHLIYFTIIVVSSTIIGVIGRHIFNVTTITWIKKIRSLLVENILKVKMKFFDSKNSSELSSELLNYSEQIKNLFISTQIQAISIAVSLISIAILFVISWKLTLVMAAALVLAVLLISPFTSLASKVQRQNEENLAKFIGVLGSVFSEIKLVKSYTAEAEEAKRVDTLNEKVRNLSIKSARAEAGIEPIMITLFILTLFVIFVYGGSLVEKGEMSIGSLIAFCLYLFQIMTPLVNIGQFFKNSKTLNELSGKLVEMFEMEKENSGSKLVGNVLQNENIVLNSVSFAYDKKKVLDNLSLTIEAKKTLAIVGPSGSGKSSLFNLLERFYSNYEGNITVAGNEIREFDLNDWRKKISYVQQMSATSEDSILKNLTYGLSENVSRELINSAMKDAGIYDYVESLPEKLDTVLNEKGSNLSSGQLQRLLIARALIRQADILLLDEVTANLDSENEALIKKTLEELRAKKTIIIIAHRLSTVTSADKIIFLDAGKITGCGSHEELLQSHPLYKKYVQNQLI